MSRYDVRVLAMSVAAARVENAVEEFGCLGSEVEIRKRVLALDINVASVRAGLDLDALNAAYSLRRAYLTAWGK